MEGENSEEEDHKKKGKKEKAKQGVVRVERGFVVGKMMKWTHPYYQLLDPETGFSKFRYCCCDADRGPSRASSW